MRSSVKHTSSKHHHHFIRVVISFVFICGAFLFSHQAFAADLSISPNTGTYSAGQTFTATIRALPNGDNVNAVEASLSYDPAVLSVVSVSKNGSAFSLWTTEPAFSNSAGTIEFGGGSPTPFTSASNLLSVTFRAVAAGEGRVAFNEASVLAADGQGTDVYENGVPGTFTVAAASEPTPTPTPEPTPEPTEPAPAADDDDEEAIVFGDPPRPPEIGSQVFLDENVWYSETNGLFTWTLPFDVDAVAFEISDDPENRPEENEDNIIDPPVEEFAISPDNISDGLQYVSVNYRNQVDWGTPTNRELRIDTTAPKPFAINVQAGNSPDAFPTLQFAAEDETSGIDFYELTVADKEPIRVTPDEAQLGYLLKELEDGTYTVKVVASDMAGNTRESSVAVLITAGWVKPVETAEETSVFDYLTPINLLIFFLFVILALMGLYIWFQGKRIKEREEKLRRETREIQDQMEKIFSALRDEVYDQILTITKRKRLSASEKEAVEGLTQALEVSETLIEKEINDVKTILR